MGKSKQATRRHRPRTQRQEGGGPARETEKGARGKAMGVRKLKAPPLPRQESSPIMQTASDLAPGPSPSSLRVCVNFGLQKKGGRRKGEERIGKRRVRTVLVSVFLPFYPIPGGGRGASGHGHGGGGGGSRLTSDVAIQHEQSHVGRPRIFHRCQLLFFFEGYRCQVANYCPTMPLADPPWALKSFWSTGLAQ